MFTRSSLNHKYNKIIENTMDREALEAEFFQFLGEIYQVISQS